MGRAKPFKLYFARSDSSICSPQSLKTQPRGWYISQERVASERGEIYDGKTHAEALRRRARVDSVAQTVFIRLFASPRLGASAPPREILGLRLCVRFAVRLRHLEPNFSNVPPQLI